MSQKPVGPFDTAILTAADPQALKNWLRNELPAVVLAALAPDDEIDRQAGPGPADHRSDPRPLVRIPASPER